MTLWAQFELLVDQWFCSPNKRLYPSVCPPESLSRPHFRLTAHVQEAEGRHEPCNLGTDALVHSPYPCVDCLEILRRRFLEANSAEARFYDHELWSFRSLSAEYPDSARRGSSGVFSLTLKLLRGSSADFGGWERRNRTIQPSSDDPPSSEYFNLRNSISRVPVA